MVEHNAVITQAELIQDDHGVLLLQLCVEYDDGCCQRFAGYFWTPNHPTEGTPISLVVWRMMEVAGTDSFAKLVGKYVRIRKGDRLNDEITAVGHITKNSWFNIKDEVGKLWPR
jgi:hypothetical protein